MRYIPQAVIPALLIALAGMITACSSLSKQECITADWYQIGLEDGSKGKPSQRLARHRKACAKAGITPDLAEYEQGHEQGLARYCNYANGLAVGTRGLVMPQYCPVGTRAQFELGYHDGRERHAQQKVVDQLANDIARLEQTQADFHQRKQVLEQRILSQNSTRESRARALSEMREIDYAQQDVAQQLALTKAQWLQEAHQLETIIARQQTPY